MKKLIVLLSIAFFSTYLLGGITASIDTYYEDVIGLTGESLMQGLHKLIKGHIMYPYFSDSTIATKDIIIQSDVDPDNPDNIILFYTGRSQNKNFRDRGDNFDYIGEYGIPHEDSWNREHVWAKSHGFPNMSDTAYTDVHHLRPADRSVNGARGNRDFDWGGYAFEEVEGCYYDFDSWEPPDRVKGDVARMMFYMVIRYEGNNKTYDLKLLDKTGTYGARFGKLSTLLQWHKLDPVDEQERYRNDVIYSYQQNRNPFIDHPEFVALIWGEPSLEPVVNISEPAMRFGTQRTGVTSQPIKLVVSGSNLSNDVLVSVKKPFFFSNKKDSSHIYECRFTPENEFLNEDFLLYFEPTEKKNYKETLIVDSHGAETTSIIISGHGIDPLAEVLLYTSFEEDFEEWTTFSVAGDKDWYHSSYGDRKFMKMSGYQANEPCVDWLITPSLDLSDYQEIIMSFETAKNHSDSIPGLEVFVSKDYIDGNDPTDYSWIPLTASLSKGYYEWEHSGYIDISGFADDHVHIAFKYNNSNPERATSWEVDDVEVIGVPIQ
ncbi:MAG TPA: hypothetical protein ENG70_03965 [Candidatus Cloacimonetes bacterium]|nr:hypothetical protein [Candidatus Cloacimonadota bacterium]HEX37998.1 hypothetical protein [Candidatus Cloacimonadota bacterium]